MFVGVLELKLKVMGSYSLKDKRRVIKSFIEKTKARFNVSICEVGDFDLWNSSEIGVAFVSDQVCNVEEVLNKIIDMVYSYSELILIYKNLRIFNTNC